MKVKTRIISAFPGTGKSYYHKEHPKTTLDSDSSEFSWIEVDGEKKRNPDFPNNYIQHLKDNIGKYEIIFVSTHKEVRKALIDNCLFFYLIYPDPFEKDIKEDFLQRFKDRGSSEKFIELLNLNWEAWVKECYHKTVGCKNIKMLWKYLEAEIDHIIRSENGEIK